MLCFPHRKRPRPPSGHECFRQGSGAKAARTDQTPSPLRDGVQAARSCAQLALHESDPHYGRYTEEEHAIFKPEIGAIAARRGVIVRYLPGHRRHDGSWLSAGPPATDDAYALAALAPDITRTDIFLCGPPPWIRAVKAAARRAGADRRHIHTEDFAW